MRFFLDKQVGVFLCGGQPRTRERATFECERAAAVEEQDSPAPALGEQLLFSA